MLHFIGTGAPLYNLAEFLVPISSLLIDNVGSESLLFLKEIIDLNSNCPLASLVVECLFINFPLEETVDNVMNDLLLTTGKVQNFAKDKLKQFFAAYQSFF